MKQCFLFSVMFVSVVAVAAGRTVVVDVPAVDGDATGVIHEAVGRVKAAGQGGDTAVMRFRAGAVYNISRAEAEAVMYHVSNTTSTDENPSPVKHIGILLKDMSNVVVDGNGATLLTHGEMTPWVIDGCRNVEIRNLTVDAADPSVPEMTVIETDSLSFTAKVHEKSRYAIRNGRLYWQGEGWEFTDGIAQIYYPETKSTSRCSSPVVLAEKVEEVEPGVLKFWFTRRMKVTEGQTYQMRHSLRTEVAGLINESENVRLKDLRLRFMGNFGIVAQVCKDISYEGLVCAPDPESGRTCAGFADFLQVSGCRGKVTIKDCEFDGSHDDPINVHGTHLKITEQLDERQLNLRYMHPQTFGFQSFFAGDTIEIVNPATLLPIAEARVKSAELVDDYNIVVTLEEPLTRAVSGAVVENVSYTPAVEISGCKFNATPTRGILVTTRRPIAIVNNVFMRTPMASILVADDGRSWYESGPVKDLKICDNTFIDCSLPVIQIKPEVSEVGGAVHSNILISGNRYIFTNQYSGNIYDISGARNVKIED